MEEQFSSTKQQLSRTKLFPRYKQNFSKTKTFFVISYYEKKIIGNMSN